MLRLCLWQDREPHAQPGQSPTFFVEDFDMSCTNFEGFCVLVDRPLSSDILWYPKSEARLLREGT